MRAKIIRMPNDLSRLNEWDDADGDPSDYIQIKDTQKLGSKFQDAPYNIDSDIKCVKVVWMNKGFEVGRPMRYFIIAESSPFFNIVKALDFMVHKRYETLYELDYVAEEHSHKVKVELT